MYPVSEAYRAAMASGGISMRTTLEAYRGSALMSDEFELTAGDVHVDVRDPLRRSFQGTVVTDDGSLVPLLVTDPLMPNGVELVVRSGPVLADGTTELIPTGRFRLTTTRSLDTGEIELAGYDLGYTVQTPLSRPLVIDAGTEVGDACAQIILAKNPAIELAIVDTGRVTPFMVIDTDVDPFETCRKLAFTAGCEAFFDQEGRFRLTSLVTQPASVPVASFVEGENATFWRPTREIVADGVPSEVIVEANHSGLTTPIRVVVQDTNPESPTYIGTYGKVTESVTSDKVATIDQAYEFGQGVLASKAWVERFAFECMPDWSLAENDTILITRERLGLHNQLALIEHMSLPGRPGAMTIQAAVRREPDYGSFGPDA